MKREIFNPASEAEWLALREEDITSTQVSALFGSCPYLTLYELWNNKAGILPPAFEPNERVVWGQRLENAIAKGVAEDRGWSIRRKSAYMRLPEIRVGASFDYEILGMDAVLEIKNVSGLAFKDNWIVEGGEIIECPVHIEMQLQTQLMVSGKSKGYIAALVGGNTLQVLEREPQPNVHKEIALKASAFWETIKVGRPPMPDFVKDYETISWLYSDAQAGKIYDGTQDTWLTEKAKEYAEWHKQESLASDQKKAIAAQIKMRIEDHAKVIGDGFSIDCAIRKGWTKEITKQDYRHFQIHWKKVRET